jgi:hypothetical protein
LDHPDCRYLSLGDLLADRQLPIRQSSLGKSRGFFEVELMIDFATEFSEDNEDGNIHFEK